MPTRTITLLNLLFSISDRHTEFSVVCAHFKIKLISSMAKKKKIKIDIFIFSYSFLFNFSLCRKTNTYMELEEQGSEVHKRKWSK